MSLEDSLYTWKFPNLESIEIDKIDCIGASTPCREKDKEDFDPNSSTSSTQALSSYADNSGLEKAQNYVCHVCGKGFLREFFFKRHLSNHTVDTGGQTVSCNYCSKTFIKVEYLKLHMRFHMQNIQHKDSDVEYNSSYESTYKYSCEYCSYKTNFQPKMTLHKVSHSKECPYCDFRTFNQTLLKSHILSIHNKLVEVGRQSRKDGLNFIHVEAVDHSSGEEKSYLLKGGVLADVEQYPGTWVVDPCSQVKRMPGLFSTKFAYIDQVTEFFAEEGQGTRTDWREHNLGLYEQIEAVKRGEAFIPKTREPGSNVIDQLKPIADQEYIQKSRIVQNTGVIRSGFDSRGSEIKRKSTTPTIMYAPPNGPELFNSESLNMDTQPDKNKETNSKARGSGVIAGPATVQERPNSETEQFFKAVNNLNFGGHPETDSYGSVQDEGVDEYFSALPPVLQRTNYNENQMLSDYSTAQHLCNVHHQHYQSHQGYYPQEMSLDKHSFSCQGITQPSLGLQHLNPCTEQQYQVKVHQQQAFQSGDFSLKWHNYPSEQQYMSQQGFNENQMQLSNSHQSNRRKTELKSKEDIMESVYSSMNQPMLNKRPNQRTKMSGREGLLFLDINNIKEPQFKLDEIFQKTVQILKHKNCERARPGSVIRSSSGFKDVKSSGRFRAAPTHRSLTPREESCDQSGNRPQNSESRDIVLIKVLPGNTRNNYVERSVSFDMENSKNAKVRKSAKPATPICSEYKNNQQSNTSLYDINQTKLKSAQLKFDGEKTKQKLADYNQNNRSVSITLITKDSKDEHTKIIEHKKHKTGVEIVLVPFNDKVDMEQDCLKGITALNSNRNIVCEIIEEMITNAMDKTVSCTGFKETLSDKPGTLNMLHSEDCSELETGPKMKTTLHPSKQEHQHKEGSTLNKDQALKIVPRPLIGDISAKDSVSTNSNETQIVTSYIETLSLTPSQKEIKDISELDLDVEGLIIFPVDSSLEGPPTQLNLDEDKYMDVNYEPLFGNQISVPIVQDSKGTMMSLCIDDVYGSGRNFENSSAQKNPSFTHTTENESLTLHSWSDDFESLILDKYDDRPSKKYDFLKDDSGNKRKFPIYEKEETFKKSKHEFANNLEAIINDSRSYDKHQQYVNLKSKKNRYFNHKGYKNVKEVKEGIGRETKEHYKGLDLKKEVKNPLSKQPTTYMSQFTSFVNSKTAELMLSDFLEDDQNSSHATPSKSDQSATFRGIRSANPGSKVNLDEEMPQSFLADSSTDNVEALLTESTPPSASIQQSARNGINQKMPESSACRTGILQPSCKGKESSRKQLEEEYFHSNQQQILERRGEPYNYLNSASYSPEGVEVRFISDRSTPNMSGPPTARRGRGRPRKHPKM